MTWTGIENAQEMWLGDFDVYIDDGTVPAFYVSAEKELKVSREFAEFKKGIPQKLVRKDLLGISMTIGFKIMQWNVEALQLALGGTITTETGYKKLTFDATNAPEKKFLFVGTRADGKAIEFCVLEGQAIGEISIPTGGKEHNGIPCEIEAHWDETTDSFGYCRVET